MEYPQKSMAAAILERINTLRRTKLFRHAGDSELAEISRLVTVHRLRRDEPLVFEGEEARELFVLVQGSLRLYREAADGREQVISIEYPVSTVNEVHLFDSGPHAFSISACEEALVWSLPITCCRQKLADLPQLAWNGLELMARRLRNAIELVHSLSLLGVDQRLARFLLEEAQQRGRRQADGWHVELTMSNQQIGAVVGAVREVVSRSMSKLQRQRLILFHNRTVIIPDEELLWRFACSKREIPELTVAAG